MFLVAVLAVGFAGSTYGQDWVDGDYTFTVPLADYLLIGTLPVTVVTDVGTSVGTFDIQTYDAKGNIAGTLDIDGESFTFSGKVKFGAKSTLKGTAVGSETIKFKGELSGAAFVGTAKVSGGGTGTFTLDLSGASAMTVAIDVNLTASSKGKLTGSGAATIAGTDFDVVAKGAAKSTVKLSVKSSGFSWSGNGLLSAMAYKAKGFGASSTGVLAITAPESNEAPIANNQSVSASADSGTSITLTASDADGDSLTYSIISGPANGTLSGTAPNVTYTPDAGYSGSDSFTFQANDGTDNSNTATVSITVQQAATIEQKTADVLPLPTISVNPPNPAGGETTSITVDADGATSINLVATGEGCGDFSTHSMTSGVPLSRAAGEFGQCLCTATVVTAEGTQEYVTTFLVEPLELDLPAVGVPGGIFQPGTIPSASGSENDPDIASIEAPGTLIAGGTAEMRITLANPAQAANIATALVQPTGATGYTGYYEVPVALDDDGQTVLVDVRLDREYTSGSQQMGITRDFSKDALKKERRFAPQRAALEDNDLLIELILALLDIDGNVGATTTQEFTQTDVATGPTTITLSWNNTTDVDLYVVEPGGTEIYYSNKTGTTGGQLDHDSTCSNYQGAVEHIVWENGAPPGDYTVRVNFWSDCASGDDPPVGASWTVTVDSCGQQETFYGSYSPGSDTGGGFGAGQVVTTFTSNCGSRVRGKATYDDYAQTTTGLATTATKKPIRFCKVEVKRASDDVTLGEGDTKQDGTFDVSFQNDDAATDPCYYVLVMADQDSAFVKQQVENGSGDIYTVRAPATGGFWEMDKQDVKVEAALTTGAPAFNIFDMGILGAALIKKTVGANPPQLTWEWTAGQQGSCGSDVSCYMGGSSKISVLGIAADKDEYDDLVLLHEYGHYVMDNYSDDDSPGGSHGSCNYYPATLTFSEAMATIFGCSAKGTSTYLDTDSGGLAVRSDLEAIDTCVPLGTQDGTQGGKSSEDRIGGIIWDMMDSTNEPNDTLSKPTAIWGSIKHLKTSTSDRGATGADLTDLLDAWFYLKHANTGTNTTGVKGITKGIHGFNYDFNGPQPPAN